MDIFQGIIIGIVQGLTEFLPVSSSAHLVFIQKLLGVEASLSFSTFLHLGTLIAVMWFFRWDIYKMLKSWWLSIGDILQGRFKEGFYSDPYKRLAWYVILATIPVGIVGVLFEDSVDALFSGALYVPAFFLFVTGTILYLSQRMTSGDINYDTITKKEYYQIIGNKIDENLSDFEKKVLTRFAAGDSYVKIAEKLDAPVKSIDNAIQRIRKKANKNIISEE